jgi:hypothetical protein
LLLFASICFNLLLFADASLSQMFRTLESIDKVKNQERLNDNMWTTANTYENS